MTRSTSDLADDAMENAYRARPELRPTEHKAKIMSKTKYEELTPMQRAHLAQTNDREFRALKIDHAARLAALEAQVPQCKTRAEYKRVTESIRAMLHIPKGSREQGPSAA
jgi:hypothetical protein